MRYLNGASSRNFNSVDPSFDFFGGFADKAAHQNVLDMTLAIAWVRRIKHTHFTYPLALQVTTAISSYHQSTDRVQDVRELRAHVLKILNRAIAEITAPASLTELKYPEKFTEFLFGGYSWETKKFVIWRISYSLGVGIAHSTPPKTPVSSQIARETIS